MKPITSDCETSLRQENEELCISKRALEKKIEELLDLQEQYKSHEVAMDQVFGGEWREKNKCRHLENIITAKDRKIIALVDQILKHSDATIEPKTYSSNSERKLWTKRHSESEYDPEVQKKYTF
ncbi:hypothetical protein RclHR1_26950005 [Rhizophagus clarus]|uniref:Uncharacterized protein n=1 Tax=Rhizophagus clarus TaxID=94130 RepID=A0A2Z6RGW8_9GLOM|nr:hypothetical protein RclHR1_26950005 [Rhizophagus clarus]